MTTPSFADAARELDRVLAASHADLAAIMDHDASQPHANAKWSRKQIIGHLIDSASNNHQRFVRGVETHRGRFPGYDQAFCVHLQRPNDVPWPVLVDLWSNYNRYLAHVIASLPPESSGYPMNVADNPVVDLLWIAVDYVEHLKHHLNQVLGSRFESTYPNTPFDRVAAMS
ncbi:MAG: DinB family protein [bacterium]